MWFGARDSTVVESERGNNGVITNQRVWSSLLVPGTGQLCLSRQPLPAMPRVLGVDLPSHTEVHLRALHFFSTWKDLFMKSLIAVGKQKN